MRDLKRFLTTAAIFFAFSSTAFGQASKTPAKPETARFGDPTGIARKYQSYLYGVVKKIDKDEIVLEKTKFGVDTTIKLFPKTKYVSDGKPSSLGELNVGDQVYVDVKTDKKTGDMSAKKVVSGVISET
jgi:hypothetical protein